MRLVASLDPTIFALALLVGVAGAYAAFDLARRAPEANGWAKVAWLAGAASGMGIGTWSVNLIVMLSARLTIPVVYELGSVIPSMLAVIAGSGAALALAYSRHTRRWHLPAGALLLVLAAESAEQIALRGTPDDIPLEWGAGIVGLSFWFVTGGALAGLWLARELPRLTGFKPVPARLLGALAMGGATALGQLAEITTARLPVTPLLAAAAAPAVSAGALAGLVAIAALLVFSATLIGARAHERLSTNAAALLTGAEVARELSGRSDARQAVCEAACRVSGAHFSMLFEPDKEGHLASTATWGRNGLSNTRVAIGGEPSGAVVAFTSRQRFVVLEAHGHPAVSQRLIDVHGIESVVFEPVLREGESVGVLVLAWAKRIRRVPGAVLLVTGLLTAQAAIAIERADLIEQMAALAGTDALTGLANRRTWDEDLPRELARARREGRALSVAMIDLDHFKRFNDLRGRQAGDRQLKETTAAWVGALRESDLLARYGGEEFAVLLPGSDVDTACQAIERLRRATTGGQTCSSGVARWDGEESGDALVARADRALYAAKHAGRDCTLAASLERAR